LFIFLFLLSFMAEPITPVPTSHISTISEVYQYSSILNEKITILHTQPGGYHILVIFTVLPVLSMTSTPGLKYICLQKSTDVSEERAVFIVSF
jgi:hypothetical protein